MADYIKTTSIEELGLQQGMKRILNKDTGKFERCEFDITDIDAKVLDDFWRTKNNLIEIIATETINVARELIDEYAKKGEKQLLLSVRDNGVGLSSAKDGFRRPINRALFYYFEGYNVAALIKALYMKNQNNNIGKYLVDLMCFVGDLENTVFRVNGDIKYIEPGYFEMISFEEKKGLFGVATLKFKAKLTDFYSDLVNAIEKLEAKSDNPLYFEQRRYRGYKEEYITKETYEDTTLFSEYMLKLKCKRDIAERIVELSDLNLFLCIKL